MLKMVCKLLIFVLLCFTFSRGTDITFKNVSIKFLQLPGPDDESMEGQKTQIPFSNSLKDFLPKIEYDTIEIKGQRIPILYEDSLADLGLTFQLEIKNSHVHEIRPGALKNNRFLDRLSLAGNDLEEIREGVFSNLKLSFLDLRNNKISSIEDGAFDNMTQLKVIILGFNKIATWNKNWFQNTPNLYDIWMHHNFMEEIPQEAFKNLKGNHFEIFRPNLMFNHNKIKSIHPDAFKGVDQISILDLGHNQLQNFDGNCLNNVNVYYLSIENNNIVCLQGDYKIIFKARMTDIDNPFDCECFNKIKTWLDENGKLVRYLDTEKKCTIEAATLK